MGENLMPKTILSNLAALLAGVLVSAAAMAADPSMHEVYQAAEAGRYIEAQAMMDQVLRDHPNSAKAHFVEAELLAKQGRGPAAQAELAIAERLEPGLPFAKAAAVQDLKARIAAPRTSVSPPQLVAPLSAPPAGSNVPWGMLLAGAAAIGAVVLFLRSRNRPAPLPMQSPAMAGYGGPMGSSAQPAGMPGYGVPGSGPMAAPQAGGMGSTLMGGLAAGAAAGVGMVAAEALMHRVMDGGHHDGTSRQADTYQNISDQQVAEPKYDMGGNDFGVADASSWDDGGSSGGGTDDWN